MDAFSLDRGSKHCDRGRLDIIFSATDSDAKLAAHPDAFNQVHALNRQEMLRLLVRIAIARYLLSGETGLVASAVRSLFEQQLLPCAGSPSELGPAHDANQFRRRYCYTEPVTRVLEQHAPRLRQLFGHYAALRGVVSPSPSLEPTSLAHV